MAVHGRRIPSRLILTFVTWILTFARSLFETELCDSVRNVSQAHFSIFPLHFHSFCFCKAYFKLHKTTQNRKKGAHSIQNSDRTGKRGHTASIIQTEQEKGGTAYPEFRQNRKKRHRESGIQTCCPGVLEAQD
jgi:hypothetical protein